MSVSDNFDFARSITLTCKKFILCTVHKIDLSKGNLAQKARIEIPLEYGRNLLGVLDETGILDYGQIFLQYSENFDSPRDKTKVLQGSFSVSFCNLDGWEGTIQFQNPL